MDNLNYGTLPNPLGRYAIRVVTNEAQTLCLVYLNSTQWASVESWVGAWCYWAYLPRGTNTILGAVEEQHHHTSLSPSPERPDSLVCICLGNWVNVFRVKVEHGTATDMTIYDRHGTGQAISEACALKLGKIQLPIKCWQRNKYTSST